MRLTDLMDESVIIDGKEHKVDMSFDNILRFYELYDDQEIDDYIKLNYMFEMLLFNSEEIEISLEFKKQVVEQILFNYVAQEKQVVQEEETESKQDDKKVEEETTTREYDFSIDADLIYASFVYDYKIDLFEEQGSLHWVKFIALLNGLSENSPLMKVINIRTCEIPVPNKHNAKEIAKMRELKRKYSLGQPGEKNMQSGLSKAATFLRSKAKEKVGDVKK